MWRAGYRLRDTPGRVTNLWVVITTVRAWVGAIGGDSKGAGTNPQLVVGVGPKVAKQCRGRKGGKSCIDDLGG